MFRYTTPRRIRIRGQISDRYYVRRYDTVTRQRVRVSTGRTSLKAALEQVRAWEVAEASGKAAAEAVPLERAVKAWLELKQTRMTPRGHETYASYCQRWLEHFSPRLPLQAVTRESIEGYFKERRLEVSAATLNKERILWRALFRWASKRGWCDRDPLDSLERFHEERRDIRVLTPDEERILLRACREPYVVQVTAFRNAGGSAGGRTTEERSEWSQTYTPPPWLHPLVFLGLRTGLRYGNLEALEWSWVDLEERVIRIPAARMKAREAHGFPIDTEVAGLLRDLRRGVESLRVLSLPDRANVRKVFQAAIERAGIRRCRFHDLRATFITRCRQAGIDVEVTAKLAAHRDVKTTLKFYRRVSDQDLRDAVVRLQSVSKTPPTLDATPS
ncbi:MAG: tyrosine-type recombinase/integrase [Planctomycetes bacterium]|nr:tyrosine-type recombinase/integrase [Planctomycetota bacterium]